MGHPEREPRQRPATVAGLPASGPKGEYILVLDQGTSSSRAILFDAEANAVSLSQEPVATSYPGSGWVEQDAERVWRTTRFTAREAIRKAGIAPKRIAALGIANQRETVVLWDRENGVPIHPAIVWQDRRTLPLCERLRADGLEDFVRNRTGLTIDPYFSASKVAWLLKHVPGARAAADHGRLAMGTVDSWLLWNLTRGRTHVVEVSNASRTLLLDRLRLTWDEDLCRLFAIPRALLPDIVPSIGPIAATDPEIFSTAIPILAVNGDQQAALFGHGGLAPGRTKVTYGTGAFVMQSTADHSLTSSRGLLSSVAWQRGRDVTYALEGSIFAAGSVVDWLRDGLGLFAESSELDGLIGDDEPWDETGVLFVPALDGLGAPYWDARVRGTFLGISHATSRREIARAAVEAIAHQVCDVLDAMDQDAGSDVGSARRVTCDGGVSQSHRLLQTQADLGGREIVRLEDTETTARGIALEVGVALGWWDMASVADRIREGAVFFPRLEETSRTLRRATWQRAVQVARSWPVGTGTGGSQPPVKQAEKG